MKVFFPSGLLIVACGLTFNLSCAQAEYHAPESHSIVTKNMQSLGLLRPSFYWVALETKETAKKSKKLFDEAGNLLTAITPTYYKKLAMEGTGKLLNGKIINFKSRRQNADGTIEILWRFCPADAPFGYGLEDLKLVPYRSVAVDLTVIPLGSKVFIPAAVGVKLPDGSRHDGYFTAVDIGDLIKDKKIDIFTAYGDQSHVFESAGLQTGKMTEVFVVK